MLLEDEGFALTIVLPLPLTIPLDNDRLAFPASLLSLPPRPNERNTHKKKTRCGNQVFKNSWIVKKRKEGEIAGRTGGRGEEEEEEEEEKERKEFVNPFIILLPEDDQGFSLFRKDTIELLPLDNDRLLLLPYYLPAAETNEIQ
ncbi:hypothetical protein K435DRAFT_837591 [Dendrothele bispora CBS 962.96]|uniref:Uncharacterized protein n=1 Tax=Dendrothele bispora (strain CBS 962.96) TaxID=1314807 RepID=A0A4S8MBM5_DENBC|nr:hypothetical protein K435DRAFT_837591 [Dendrothele bispora CBS 962.96]